MAAGDQPRYDLRNLSDIIKKGFYYEPTKPSCAVLENLSNGHTEFSA